MYHFAKETLKNLEIFKRKNGSFFKKVTRKSNASSKIFFFFFFNDSKAQCPLVQTLSHLNFFFGRFGNLDFFFLDLKYIYIHEQSTSNATWTFRIQRNIETWDKQKNFKLNHDVANQMWSEAKLGYLLLLGPFRMLEIGYA